MDSRFPLTDWSLIQSFLAVAETGSLSAAARQLGRSQPTLGRQIRELEQSLGGELFERHARGLRPNALGERILPMAKRIREAVHEVALSAAGQTEKLEGSVRITASVFVSHYLLPAILAEIRQAEPAIQLELVPSDSSENLLFRQADIAVRMYRPTQLDIVARQVATIGLGIYAARSYVERRGLPESAADLVNHDLVGYDSNDLIIREMRKGGLPVSRENFAVRCDNQAVYWELVRAGCGLGFSQRGVAGNDPDIVEVGLEIQLPSLPVWLAAHQAMRHTPRIRRVWDLLARGIAQSAG